MGIYPHIVGASGNLVGMAYVVPRHNGRFEVRESVHTPRGPRARTLAGFRVLTDEVLAAARRRATRMFDLDVVLDSAKRAGAPVRAGGHADRSYSLLRSGFHMREGGAMAQTQPAARQFVDTSRRMALAFGQPPAVKPEDPGAVLIDLLGFADAVGASQPPRRFEPLAFPALGRLVEQRPRTPAASTGGPPDR